MLLRLSLLILCLPLGLQAIDLKPWFPRYLEIQSQLSYFHQRYCSVDSGSTTIEKSQKNDFYTGSLELAYDDICGEVEFTFSSTGRHHLGPDNAQATFRYQVLDDVIGDFASVVAGMTVRQVFSLSLKDISTLFHGGIEGEAHLAIGKEFTCYNTWSSRMWSVAGLGIADHGSPWIFGLSAFEVNWYETQRFRVFAEANYGLGEKNLNVFVPFNGYGNILHQSIDVGIMYRYMFENDGWLSLTVAHRAHAKNCPKQVNFFGVSYLYPFGL
ncbi:MAG: hypothetical protein VX777_05560 [Chlamydiota bacterium]|nr:hypothetical protein [Chlamydiota bacterium]